MAKKQSDENTEINTDSTQDDLLKSLKQKIVDFVKDTVTLDVLTLTGTVEMQPEEITDSGNSSNSTNKFKWDDIFKNVAEKLKTKDSGVSIVAYTHAEWDMDSVNFVASNPDSKLAEAHSKIVASAHEARMNAVKSAVEAVKSLF